MLTSRDYATALREGWLIILAGVVLLTTAAAIFSFAAPTYASRTTLSVAACVSEGAQPDCDPVKGGAYAADRARAYASLGKTAPVLGRALAALELDGVESLSETVDVSVPGNAPLVEITATWPDAATSADIANAVGDALLHYAAASIDSIDSSTARVELSVMDRATAPEEPVESSVPLISAGVLLGLLLGCIVAISRYSLNRRVRSSAEAAELAQTADLGTAQGAGEAADAFRRIRSAVLQQGVETGSVLVTPASSNADGRDVGVGLAQAMTQSQLRVLLVDADPRHDAEAGLSDVIDDAGSDPQSVIVPDERGFDVLRPGTAPDRLDDLTASPRFSTILRRLEAEYDLVIVAAPSITATTIARSAARVVPSALVVVDLGSTLRTEAEDAASAVAAAGSELVGVVTSVRS